jgi:PAS domain S-box-containing protein
MLDEFLHADTLAARVARRLVPTALLVLPIFGLLRYLGEQQGLYDSGRGVGLMVLFSMLVLGSVSWWTVSLIRRSERAQEAAETQLERFFALSPDLFVVAGFDGRFHRLNASWQATLGYGLDELTARPFLDFVHPDDRASTTTAFEQLLAGQDVIAFENRYLARDGSIHWLQWSARAVRDEGLIQAVARDVTDARRAADALDAARQEADRANRAKSEFLSRMSHELRTPMNSVLGFAQLLERDERLTEDQRASVHYITSGGRHLLQLIDEVLDIARIEAGRLPLSPEPVAVCDLIEDAVALVRPLAAERRISISVDREDCSRHVRADRQRLKQVLLNLLSNAVKYNRQAGAIHVSCELVELARFRIAVTDTGPGIAHDQLDRLFIPFDRLGAEQSGAEGTGIGLALSKGLVEAMAGSIGVDSRPGEGSTFWIEFARIEDPVERIEAGMTALAAGNAPTAVGSVLYIEDNLANVKLVERILVDRPGVRLLTAMQGRIGLELARRHRPDLVLLDLHLPDLPGQDVLHQLLTTPETSEIPVAIISADATNGQVGRLLSAGATAYLAKPLDVAELLAVVDRAVGQD